MRDLFGKALRKWRLFSRVWWINRQVSFHTRQNTTAPPVVFFNASARLEGLNLNAAFQLISSWGVQLAGRDVIHLACRVGMEQCVLGAGVGHPLDPPPCQGCISYTKAFTGAGKTNWFDYREDPDLKKILQSCSVAELTELVYLDRPLGQLVLPSIRWILRRHHLEDDAITHQLYQKFCLSAHNIAEQFSLLLNRISPEAVVVFNGLQYPEAVVRWIASRKGIRVITHEVNLQPFSAFFTEGQATIYPLDIPENFQLSPAQNTRLDDYLSRRFKGDFKMAGVKFWSGMDRLPDEFNKLCTDYQGIIPVFTNVIFDTSQAHANTLFDDMFDWLELVYRTALDHPEYLFVIRAHPDERRVGKSSKESVMAWAKSRKLSQRHNIYLIGPEQTFSSYELIQRSKFTMVYNSSIGLEASLLGKPVLCAGRARYTQYPTVFYPESRTAYQETLEQFLEADKIDTPLEFLENARKFLYFQLYRASLPFSDFLTEHPTPGYVELRSFSWKKLQPGSLKVVDCIVAGILRGMPFILEEEGDESLLQS